LEEKGEEKKGRLGGVIEEWIEVKKNLSKIFKILEKSYLNSKSYIIKKNYNNYYLSFFLKFL
jgi:hypothetical protein